MLAIVRGNPHPVGPFCSMHQTCKQTRKERYEPSFLWASDKANPFHTHTHTPTRTEEMASILGTPDKQHRRHGKDWEGPWVCLGLTTGNPCGCGSKNRYQNGTLVSGNMDQNLPNPFCLILSHRESMCCLGFRPSPSKLKGRAPGPGSAR